MTLQPETALPVRGLHLRVVAHSEVGLVRKNNQDSGYASQRLLLVADGMGGAAAGDLASAVAVDVISRLDTPDLLVGPFADEGTVAGESTAEPDRSDDGSEETLIVSRTGDSSERQHPEQAPPRQDPAERLPAEQGAAARNPLLGRLAAAIAEANSRIADLVAADYSLEGMGTTVTGAIFDGRQLALAHIGDSRAYLLRDGHLERLTHDHSWVQSLIDDGKITAVEAAYHPHRSLLLKVLNGQPANDPDLTSVALQRGDRVLFCSDGLCGMIDDRDIAQLANASDLEAAVGDLVDAALAAGGIDNITVILAEVVEGPEPSETVLAGQQEEDDTAIREPVGTILGAAAERDIPVTPRRRPAQLSGTPDDDDDLSDRGTADDAIGPSSASGASSREHPDDESRYAPGPPAKRRLVRTLLVGLVVLLVAAAGLGAGYAWTRTQYFVGDANGQVAIYQGLPDRIPGLPLSQVYEVQDLPVANLPAYYQAQLTAGIEVASLDAARATVEQLKVAAGRCGQPSPSPSPTPPKKPTPTTTTSAKPTPTATITSSAAPTGTVKPTATPTPTSAEGC